MPIKFFLKLLLEFRRVPAPFSLIFAAEPMPVGGVRKIFKGF
uniref:Uncharacterized protein n=1 Tax=Meloidogyne enterolobii TaxID=390850 RepID=A0A6V7VCH4_MELEN|nr:unnamed protein product [Meloidogyne enterolobii]